jgi:hypothetical protein
MATHPKIFVDAVAYDETLQYDIKLSDTNSSTDFDITDIDFGCEVYFIPTTTNLVAFYEKTASFQASKLLTFVI